MIRRSDLSSRVLDQMTPGLFLILALVLSSCSEPLSVINEAWKQQKDSQSDTRIMSETSLNVSAEGVVTASGPIQDVSDVSISVADALFRVTAKTSLKDEADRKMALSDVSVGTFFELEGTVAADGSFEVVSGRADEKVVLCHVPRGNPDNAHTISVGARGASAHLNHGDAEGECAEEPQDGEETTDDDSDDSEADDPETEKVTVCHIPPGNPDNARTLTIGAESLEDHLAHGDLEGPCDEEETDDEG